MARTSTRVVMNRASLDAVTLAVADGINEVVQTIVVEADPPDATPYGAGLVTQGGWITYAGTRKVDGGSIDGSTPQKPRDVRLSGLNAVVGIAGFGFPGRFQETGTVNHPAQPFVWPSLQRVEGRVAGIMAPAVRARLRELRGGA